jgi:hypothetical protein
MHPDIDDPDDGALEAVRAIEQARRHPLVRRTRLVEDGAAMALQELLGEPTPREAPDQALVDLVAREALCREVPDLSRAVEAHADRRTPETERAALDVLRRLRLSVRAITATAGLVRS